MENNRAYRILSQLMKGKLSVDKRIDVYRWVLSEMDDLEKDDAFWQVWEETSSTPDSSVNKSLLETKEKIKATEGYRSKVSLFIRIARYAAILVLPLISGALVWYVVQQNQIEPEIIECYAPFSETRKIDLSDGSHICVNAGSLLIYPEQFTGKTRSVYLTGEAFFDIASMADKPFIVKANGQEIKVLGTKFNVLAYPNDSLVITTLMDGSVELSTIDNESVVLGSNQQYVYNKHTRSGEINNTNASQLSRWTTGYYSFSEDALSTVFNRLSQIYGYIFILTTESLKDKILTATFYKDQRIDDILEIISLSIPIEYRIEGRQITISENNKK